MSVFAEKNLWGLILGASSGMGLATAKKLAGSGMNLILVYRERRSRQTEVDEAFNEMRAMGVQVMDFNTDALQEAKREQVLEEIVTKIGDGKIRLLMHSIAKGNLKLMTPTPEDGGIAYPSQLLTDEDFAITGDSMAFSIVPWLNAILAKDLVANPARVIALTSAGDKRVWKGYAAVAAAKASLDAIIKYIAVEYAHLGITSNLIEAGVTVTPSMQLIPGSEEMIERIQEQHPKKRLTLPEDVANAIYLLTQDEANWINGSRLIVDGGETLI